MKCSLVLARLLARPILHLGEPRWVWVWLLLNLWCCRWMYVILTVLSLR